MDPIITASERRCYKNAHSYHVNSISVCSDGQHFISADDLRINMWNLDRQKSFSASYLLPPHDNISAYTLSARYYAVNAILHMSRTYISFVVVDNLHHILLQTSWISNPLIWTIWLKLSLPRHTTPQSATCSCTVAAAAKWNLQITANPRFATIISPVGRAS